MQKLIIVEDDETIRMGLSYCLEQEGFEVVGVGALKEAREILQKEIPSLMLLDINLPDGNGFDFYQEIQKNMHFPLIFLTANDLEVSIVRGLDMGADDYITKPFKTRELIARIHSVMRRYQGKEVKNKIQIQDLVIDLNAAKVYKKGVDIFLTALEYKILLILALNPSTVFTREKILADIWDVDEKYVNDNTLTVYMKRLREKIEDNPENPKIIKTVRGMGYKVVEREED